MTDNDDFYPNLFRSVDDACSSGWLTFLQRDTVFLALKAYRPSTARPDPESVHATPSVADFPVSGDDSSEGVDHVHVHAGNGAEALSSSKNPAV